MNENRIAKSISLRETRASEKRRMFVFCIVTLLYIYTSCRHLPTKKAFPMKHADTVIFHFVPKICSSLNKSMRHRGTVRFLGKIGSLRWRSFFRSIVYIKRTLSFYGTSNLFRKKKYRDNFRRRIATRVISRIKSSSLPPPPPRRSRRHLDTQLREIRIEGYIGCHLRARIRYPEI